MTFRRTLDKCRKLGWCLARWQTEHDPAIREAMRESDPDVRTIRWDTLAVELLEELQREGLDVTEPER